MLKYIIKREIHDNLLTLRLSLTLILTVFIMTVSAFIFIDSHKEARTAYAANRRGTRSYVEAMFTWKWDRPWTLWRVLSINNQWVYKRPSDFAFLADGHDKDLPNAFTVNAFQNEGPNTRLHKNPLLRPFESLDWSLVMGVIMSFAAIVLTFDAISGDRERGTLQLVMSNSIPRATLLLGKYIGALVTLSIPLLVGILLNIIIIAISGVVLMDGLAWVHIGIVSLFSLLYVAGFISLGIFVSSMTRESATSLSVLLLSWAMLVIVIPSVSSVIASRAVAVPGPDEVSANATHAWHRAKNEYLARHREMRGIAFRSPRGSSDEDLKWLPGDNLAGLLAAYEARDNVRAQYRDAMLRQVKVGQNITRISPLGLYRHAVEAIAGTGISHYSSFMKQVRRYREFLKDVMIDKYPLDPHKHYAGPWSRPIGWTQEKYQRFKETMEKVDFKLSDVPEFYEEPIAVEEAMKTAIWDIFSLFLFSLLFFMGSVVAFLRYDVR